MNARRQNKKENNQMKKAISAIIAGAVLTLALAALSACTGGGTAKYDAEVSDTLVVFVAEEVSGDMSVKDYFDGLAEEGKLTYTISGGMVTEINGKENVSGTNEGDFWMFYSDLTELDGVIYANPDYGTYEYNGKTLASCSYGIEGMPVVEGYTYAAVYRHTSW